MRFMKSNVLDIIKWDGSSERLSKLNNSVAFFNDCHLTSGILSDRSYFISNNNDELIVPIGESLVVFNNGALASTGMISSRYKETIA